jgi:LPLT family lysophospholipid transporter-like MFS transporter
MTTTQHPIGSRAMVSLLSAQFLSALADNALLFAAIALLQVQFAPNWQIPLLQEFFVLAYIVLAPFVGPFADSYPKGRVMLIANAIKLVGASAMLLGLNPLVSYGLVGLGAAAYSPAKYGILSELVSREQLVKANALMEGSTIVAILLGAVVGGFLASNHLSIALIAVCSCYFAAALMNLLIPKLPAFKPVKTFAPIVLVQHFKQVLISLIVQRDARLALLGGSVFWGAGATLRLLLVAWVPVALHNSDISLPANLSGVVAIGIALGAAMAAKFVRLKDVARVLPVGISIGVLIILFAHSTNLYVAIGLLIFIGAAGGFYVVPLNALLQQCGHATVGAGNAVGVQNFFENCSMLLLVGLYVLMERSGLPVVQAATIFGCVIFVSIGLIARARLRQERLA